MKDGAMVNDVEQTGQAIVDSGVHRTLPCGGRSSPGRLTESFLRCARQSPVIWLIRFGKGFPLQLRRAVFGGTACAFKLSLDLLNDGGHLPAPQASGW